MCTVLDDKKTSELSNFILIFFLPRRRFGGCLHTYLFTILEMCSFQNHSEKGNFLVLNASKVSSNIGPIFMREKVPLERGGRMLHFLLIFGFPKQTKPWIGPRTTSTTIWPVICFIFSKTYQSNQSWQLYNCFEGNHCLCFGVPVKQTDQLSKYIDC